MVNVIRVGTLTGYKDSDYKCGYLAALEMLA